VEIQSSFMKPRFYHYIIAHFPAIIAQAGGVFLVSTISVICAPVLSDNKTEFFLSVLVSYPLGALLATVFISPIVSLLIVNPILGSSLKVGDEVFILRGKRKGKITSIHAISTERGQIQLNLSEDERQTGADIYSSIEVCGKSACRNLSNKTA